MSEHQPGDQADPGDQAERHPDIDLELAENAQLTEQRNRAEYHQKTATTAAHELQVECERLVVERDSQATLAAAYLRERDAARAKLNEQQAAHDLATSLHTEWSVNFVGPCAHGRDPYTRCDYCGDLDPGQAFARVVRIEEREECTAGLEFCAANAATFSFVTEARGHGSSPEEIAALAFRAGAQAIRARGGDQ